MKNEGHERIEGIEYLRAAAILITLLAHLRALVPWPEPWIDFLFRNGTYWAGVDLFFAVSGFVIARDMLKRLDQAVTSAEKWNVLKAFWVRRATRILPSAWLWLAIGVAGAIWFNEHSSFGVVQRTVHDAIAAVLQVANFNFWHCWLHQDCGFNQVYWSLSVEEQFYLMFPFIAIFFGRRVWMPITLIWVVCIALPRPLYSQLHFAPSPQDLSIFVRLDAICAGVTLAFLERERGRLRPVFGQRASSIFVAALIASLVILPGYSYDQKPPLFFWASNLISIPAIILVWFAVTSWKRPWTGAGAKVALWIGSRSYAIYLVHYPAIEFTRECLVMHVPQTNGGAAVYVVAASTLTAALAEINFRFVEMPIRRMGRRWADNIERSRHIEQPVPSPLGRTTSNK
jgi:peptidoglycan/LPS O-acetylase OafA/YrhL